LADRQLQDASGGGFTSEEIQCPSKEWDHDHCSACWATFADIEGPEILHEGYATTADYKLGADYDWICPTCFAELRDVMNWTEVD
jgi:hypothetical protein